MKVDVEEEARRFDMDRSIKRRVTEALEKLETFRVKYPFAEDQDSIEKLRPEDVIKTEGKETGDFFLYVQYYLSDLGHLILYTNDVYYHIRSQLETFKELLYTTVDKEKSLSEKVDAPWNEIKGLGGDRHIAKKIIFCFNYNTDTVVPIFSTPHLEHFLNKIQEPTFPFNYESLTLGEKYEFLTNKIFEAKESSPITKSWEITYFCWFLYTAYPPPEKPSILQAQQENTRAVAVLEQQKQLQDFMALLNNLRRKDKITAEELRTYRDQWQRNPQDRETITSKLSAL